jgi:hypothetical protein
MDWRLLAKYGNGGARSSHGDRLATATETIPYDSLKLVDNRIVLPGGTKQTLKMLPEFKYSAK